MPFSKTARRLAILGVFWCLFGQAEERNGAPGIGNPESWDSAQRYAPSNAGEHQQTAWLEPTAPPSARPSDRDVKPLSAPDRRENPIPLRPPSKSLPNGAATLAPSASGPRMLISVVGSLGAVLGLFFVLAWAMRRGASGSPALLPKEALEVLGRAPLAGRQQVYLVRLGNKLLLVSVSQAGVETLSEVTEPDEVQRLAGLCLQRQTNSAVLMFRQALDRFAAHEE
jgi:flagellar biogenesis protein FliO